MLTLRYQSAGKPAALLPSGVITDTALHPEMTWWFVISSCGATENAVPVDTCALAHGKTANTANSTTRMLFTCSPFCKLWRRLDPP